MKKYLALSVCALTAPFAQAQYVGSVIGLLDDTPTDILTVSPGDSFSGAVVLDGHADTKSDFALFRLVFSAPGMEFKAGWFNWTAPFTTGGADDFSSPGAGAIGAIHENTHDDAIAIGEIDVAFENVTDNFGDYFEFGRIVEFTLSVPDDYEPGSVTIDFAPDTFTDGASFVDATSGNGLTVQVIPAPATGLLTGFGGLALSRRRH